MRAKIWTHHPCLFICNGGWRLRSSLKTIWKMILENILNLWEEPDKDFTLLLHMSIQNGKSGIVLF